MISLDVVAPHSGVGVPADVMPPDVRKARHTGTILLVENEELLRQLLADVLTKEGYTVVTKSSSEEALDWAIGKVARADLLLTDFDVEGAENGLTLAAKLPEIVGGPVPTIVLTGDITSEAFKSISSSLCHQVRKPVDPDILLSLVSNLMQTGRKLVTAKREAVRRTAPVAMHVIDDDPSIRDGLRRVFEAEGWSVLTYEAAEEFLTQPRPEGVACLVVDNLLPGISGVELIQRLRAEGSQVPAIMLTGYGDVTTSVAALKAGATDMIEKPASAADLLTSIRHAIRIADDQRIQMDAMNAAQERFSRLTEREKEVLLRVLAGQANKIIAADLGLNQRTVESHRASVMRKTGTRSLPALVRLALAADVQGGQQLRP